MKKAIILINGLGLGNSTRCKVLIDWLFSKNYEVTILTSGNGEEFFNTKKYNIIKLDRIDYGKISERLSILKLFVLKNSRPKSRGLSLLEEIFFKKCHWF